MEASTTRGTTALVYCLIISSLYTGTVQRWWSTPNWLDGHKGCSQLATYSFFICGKHCMTVKFTVSWRKNNMSSLYNKTKKPVWEIQYSDQWPKTIREALPSNMSNHPRHLVSFFLKTTCCPPSTVFFCSLSGRGAGGVGSCPPLCRSVTGSSLTQGRARKWAGKQSKAPALCGVWQIWTEQLARGRRKWLIPSSYLLHQICCMIKGISYIYKNFPEEPEFLTLSWGQRYFTL